jgi:hypothetical protein
LVDAEGRRHYRVTPGEEYTLDVTVETVDGRSFPGELLDITIEGAGTRFLRQAGPALAVGQSATLTFTSARLRHPIHVRAKVRSRAELGAFRSYRYGFEFDEREELARQLSGEIHQLFNQRGIYRVQPDPAQPLSIVITLLPEDHSGPEGFETVGTVKDISIVGAAILVDRSAETTLAATDLIQAMFRLPSSSSALRFAAWIRHRELQDNCVCYGLEFNSIQSANFKQQQNEVLKYARRRRLAEPPKRFF